MTIGWYVHSHGRGHLTRMIAIAAHLDATIRCFSSLPRPRTLPGNCEWVELARDDEVEPGSRDPADSDPTVGGMLHWAPVGHSGHRDRLVAIAASLSSRPVDAFVVDVSVEIALFVRLLGVRTVVIAQPGLRDDAAHALAYRSATAIIAPWPEPLLMPAHLRAVRERTVFTGGISRFEERMSAARHEPGADVVLLGGGGGGAISAAQVGAAAARSGRRWRVLGGVPGASWVDDPWHELSRAHVVVSFAGQNAVADIAAAGAPAVVVPQERPFAEQVETARALERGRLAVVQPQWPPSDAWPALIARAADLRPDWSRWQVCGAARRAADAIITTARRRG